MRVDSAAARLWSLMAEANLPCVLLKGASFRLWLYPHLQSRFYGDVDLLVPDMSHAGRLMADHGFEQVDRHPLGLSTLWVGPDHVDVDLHTNIVGVGVSELATWSVLSHQTDMIVLNGQQVSVLNEPAKCLHVALHAAAHGGAGGTLLDLEAALATAPESAWAEAARIAVQLDASQAFVAGLSLVAGGKELGSRLGVPPNRSVAVELRAQGASNAAQAIASVFEERGVVGKARRMFDLSTPKEGAASSEEPSFRRRLTKVAKGLRGMREWSETRRRLKRRTG